MTRLTGSGLRNMQGGLPVTGNAKQAAPHCSVNTWLHTCSQEAGARKERLCRHGSCEQRQERN